MKRLVSFIMALSMLTTLSACTTNQNTLTVTIDAVVSLDPAKMKDDATATVLLQCLEGLFTLDSSGIPIPAQAESYTISEDGKKYTFVLRDGLKWSDGTRVQAIDYEYSWQRMMDTELAAPYEYLFDVIEGYETGFLAVEATDAKTLTVQLKEACPYFLSLVAHPAFLPISRENSLKNKQLWDHTARAFVSNGAFRVTDWSAGSHIELTKNDKYRAPKNVQIKRMIFSFDKSGASDAFHKKKTDIILNPDTTQSQSTPSNTVRIDDGSVGFIYFRYDSEMLAQKVVREAITRCLDRTTLCNEIPQLNAMPAYRLVPGNILSVQGETMFSDGTPLIAQDTASKTEIEDLMSTAYEDDRVRLTYIYQDSPSQAKLAIKVVEQLTAVGFAVEQKPLSMDDFVKALRNGSYDLAQCMYYFEANHIYDLLSGWERGNMNNYAKWDSNAVHKIIEKYKESDSLSEKDEILRQVEKELMKQYAVCPLFFGGRQLLMQQNIGGVYMAGAGFVYLQGATK